MLFSMNKLLKKVEIIRLLARGRDSCFSQFFCEELNGDSAFRPQGTTLRCDGSKISRESRSLPSADD